MKQLCKYMHENTPGTCILYYKCIINLRIVVFAVPKSAQHMQQNSNTGHIYFRFD